MLPPLMKHPAAPGGKPAVRTRSSITWFSAATAPAPSNHDSAEKFAVPQMASIQMPATEGDSGMNARKRSLSRPMFCGAITSLNICHAPSRPSPASVMEPARSASSLALSPMTPTPDEAMRWRIQRMARSSRSPVPFAAPCNGVEPIGGVEPLGMITRA